MRRFFITLLTILTLATVCGTFVSANDESSIDKSVGESLAPDGRFDLEAARQSGYEVALDLQGIEVQLDPATDEPIAKIPYQVAPANNPFDRGWSRLDDGFNGTGAIVRAVVVYNGNLIAAGQASSVGGVPANNIASWNGSSWSALGSGVNNQIYALTVYDGKLIAAGYFTTAGGVSADRIASWDGSSWAPLGSGMNSPVLALTTYDGQLIAGGAFGLAGGELIDRIASWNGSSWSSLGSGIGGGNVHDLTIYVGNLIASGDYSEAGGVSANGVASWNGSSWSALGSGTTHTVYAVTEYDGDLIAGGSFHTAGGISAMRIASWNGSSWSTLGAGICCGSVDDLTVYGGDLIAGGNFYQAGGLSAENVAKWNGSGWSTLGSGMNGMVRALTAYGGNLIAGGSFSTAGGGEASKIAQWNDGTNEPPTADAGGPYSGKVATSIAFDASGSSDADGTIVQYAWDWDNNGSYDEFNAVPTASHSWPSEGNYTVGLKVTDDDTAFDEDDASVTVAENAPPVADAGGPYSGEAGENISFDASDSYDPDGTITQYAWDWDNNGSYDNFYSVPTTTHSWPSNGNYTVGLRVTDNDSQTDEDDADVTIGVGVPPIADAGGPYSGDVNQTILFDASGSNDPDGTIDLYEWDWDNDGNYDESSTSPTATHSWSTEGSYTVGLRVTDNDLWTDEDQAIATVFLPLVVQNVYIEPELPEIASPYIVQVVVNNPSDYPRDFELTLVQEDWRWAMESVPWDVGGNYPEEVTISGTFAPNQTATVSFVFQSSWDWIPPWDWTMLLSSFLNFAPLVGISIPPDIDVAMMALGSCDYINGQAVEYDIDDDPQQSTFGIDEQHVTVRVSFPKVLSLIASLEASYLAGFATAIGTACIYFPPCWVPLFIAEGVGIVSAQVLYIAAHDPDSNYTEVVEPEFPSFPELDTIPDSPERQFAYNMVAHFAYSDALSRAYIKAKGAELDSAYDWQSFQLGSAAQFAHLMVQETLEGRLGAAEAVMLRTPLTPEALNLAHDHLDVYGLPDVEISILTQLGVSAEAIDSLYAGLLQGYSVPVEDTLPPLFEVLQGALTAAAGLETALRAERLEVNIERLGEPVDSVSEDTLLFLEALSQEIDDSLTAGQNGPEVRVLIDSLHQMASTIADYSNDTTVLTYCRDALVHMGSFYELSFICGGVRGIVSLADTGLTGVAIQLRDSTDTIYEEVITDDSGFYFIDSIPNANYTVQIDLPVGTSYAADGEVPLTIDGEYHKIDFRLTKCGDINADGNGPNIADLTYLVAYLFGGGPPPPVLGAADVNGGDGSINIADLTYLVAYLFSGGPDPDCG